MASLWRMWTSSLMKFYPNTSSTITFPVLSDSWTCMTSTKQEMALTSSAFSILYSSKAIKNYWKTLEGRIQQLRSSSNFSNKRKCKGKETPRMLIRHFKQVIIKCIFNSISLLIRSLHLIMTLRSMITIINIIACIIFRVIIIKAIKVIVHQTIRILLLIQFMINQQPMSLP